MRGKEVGGRKEVVWALGDKEGLKVTSAMGADGRWHQAPPHRSLRHSRGPKMTAFQTMMLSWHGLPEIPSGASVARRLKSRIRRRLAAVD